MCISYVPVCRDIQVEYFTLFLGPKWALSRLPMRPKAEWAIDSEAIRERGIIVLVKSN